MPFPRPSARPLRPGSAGVGRHLCAIYRLQPATDHAVMGIGALLWLAGRPVYQVVPWWAGFLILTIAGERLELARVLLLKQVVRTTFVIAIAIFLAGLLLAQPAFDTGLRLSGIGLLALGAWLLHFDNARRTIRQKGLTRFIAACLLPGYVWLIIGGLF